jgi:hypothetical protein
MQEIQNKIEMSGIVELDLELFFDPTERIHIDIKDFLLAIDIGDDKEAAYILKEKIYRESIKQIDVSTYENKLVLIDCSVDAIIPTWAYMLLTLAITPYAKKVVIGNDEILDQILMNEAISKIDLNKFQDAKVVIKGCSKFKIPLNAYSQIVQLLKPYVKSLMYGEPCSTVPLFKRPRM